MKKNTMMRLSAILLVAVLLTTCIISGTWAKYVSTGSANDSARVARWGVTITANETTVATVTENPSGAENEVLVSSTSQIILAPGTNTTELADLTISGTPEVAVTVAYTADLVLTGWTIDEDNNNETPNTYYCPLIITVNGTPYSGSSYSSTAAFETAVENAIAALGATYTLAQIYPEIAGEVTPQNLGTIATAPQVTVAWAYDTTPAGTNDAKDTLLGNAISLSTLQLSINATIAQAD